MKKRIFTFAVIFILLSLVFSVSAEQSIFRKITSSAVEDSWFSSIINFFKGIFGKDTKGISVYTCPGGDYPPTKYCDGSKLVTCQSEEIIGSETCANGCENGACKAAPVFSISDIADKTTTVGIELSILITISNAVGNVQNTILPDNLGITVGNYDTSTIKWTPTATHVGTHIITLTSEDDWGHIATKTFKITVNAVPAPNTCPGGDYPPTKYCDGSKLVTCESEEIIGSETCANGCENGACKVAPAAVDQCSYFTASGQQRCKDEDCVWDANTCKTSCPAGKTANANKVCKSVKLKSVINNPTSSKKNTESIFSVELNNEAEFKNSLLIASILINEETSEILAFKYELVNFIDVNTYSPSINYYIPAAGLNKIKYKVFVLNSFTDLTSLLESPVSQSYTTTA